MGDDNKVGPNFYPHESQHWQESKFYQKARIIQALDDLEFYIEKGWDIWVIEGPPIEGIQIFPGGREEDTRFYLTNLRLKGRPLAIEHIHAELIPERGHINDIPIYDVDEDEVAEWKEQRKSNRKEEAL